MPSEPRSPAEPTLEELSAYLDHELDASTQARVADHVAGCTECTRRLEGLRETVNAVRALPMETPSRTFTITAQRRQSFRWAPVGWVSAGAAAALIVVAGLSQMHGHSSVSTASGGTAQRYAAAPAASQGPTTLDSHSGAASQAYNANANTVTVVDPLNSSRSLTLSTDSRTYSASGSMTVRVRLTGLPSGSNGLVGLLLERNGYGVRLPACSVTCDWSHFQASYQLDSLDLSTPVAGSYTLMAIEQLPGNADSLVALVARLPVTITP
jgi:anti-sigma factor RsiW